LEEVADFKSESAADFISESMADLHRNQHTEKQARTIINVWVKNEVLLKEDYDDPVERKTLKGLRANSVKRPGWEVRY
jgi:hypothetical protein